MSFDPISFIRDQTKITTPSLIPEIPLHLATEVTPLWQLTEERLKHSDLPPPFWAFAWPGGQGIARYILDHEDLVKNKHIVDFGAGSGVASIAAMKKGAKSALAIDIDELALQAIALNATHNQVVVKTKIALDLTKPYINADIIFAGDVCYQQMMSASLIRWLRLCVEEGVMVLLADPGRAYVPHEGLEKLASYEVPTSRDLEDTDQRTVTIWKMEKIADNKPG